MEWKAVFITPFGLFELLVMFFGLCNSLATFQTMMDSIFADLISQGLVLVYIDDILIYGGQNPKEHQDIVQKVLHILQKNQLFLNKRM